MISKRTWRIFLIILVISPMLSAAGLDRQLDETYARQTYDQELQEFQRRQQEIEEEYERRLEERVEEAAGELEALEEGSGQEASGGGQEQEGGQEEEDGVEIPEIRVKIGESEED